MAHEKENKFDLISIAKSGDEKTGHKKGKGEMHVGIFVALCCGHSLLRDTQ